MNVPEEEAEQGRDGGLPLAFVINQSGGAVVEGGYGQHKNHMKPPKHLVWGKGFVFVVMGL